MTHSVKIMNNETPLTESPKPDAKLAPSVSATQDAQAEIAALKDRHLRLAADFENYKRRAHADADRRVARQMNDLLTDLLPVLDNLKRALETAPGETSPLRTGVELTLQKFRQILRQHGCEPDDCAGKMFDPRRQETIGSRHDSSHADHMILEVVQEGWLRDGELLRPAKVIINDLTTAPHSLLTHANPSDNEPIQTTNELK